MRAALFANGLVMVADPYQEAVGVQEVEEQVGEEVEELNMEDSPGITRTTFRAMDWIKMELGRLTGPRWNS